MKRTVVWLTDEQVKALTAMSKKSLAPVSALVRQAVKEFLQDMPKPVLGQAEEEKVRLHGLLASVLHSICCRSGGSLYSTTQTSKVIRLHGRLVSPRLDYPFAKSRETLVLYRMRASAEE